MMHGPINMSIGYLWQDTDRAKLKLSEKNHSYCNFSFTSHLTEWAGIEPGPVGVGFVTDKVTFELQVTCTAVGQMTEFEISLEI